jgi:hypothetical protein
MSWSDRYREEARKWQTIADYQRLSPSMLVHGTPPARNFAQDAADCYRQLAAEHDAYLEVELLKKIDEHGLEPVDLDDLTKGLRRRRDTDTP